MNNEINAYILIAMLLAASYFDIKEKRIPNFLTFPAILWGIIFACIRSGFEGLQFSIIGCLFGIAAFFIPFALNFMGAGDVKLMGAVGALMGWKFTLFALLYAAIAGGIIVVIIAIYNRRMVKILLAGLNFILTPLLGFIYKKTSNVRIRELSTYFNAYKFDNNKEYIPYGVAITIGTFFVLSGLTGKIL